MRTRKRLRDRDTDVKVSSPAEEIVEDFLDADYKKVQRLLVQTSREDKYHKINDSGYEDRSSTEADFKPVKTNKCIKDSDSVESSQTSTKSIEKRKVKGLKKEIKISTSDKKRINETSPFDLKSSKKLKKQHFD